MGPGVGAGQVGGGGLWGLSGELWEGISINPHLHPDLPGDPPFTNCLYSIRIKKFSFSLFQIFQCNFLSFFARRHVVISVMTKN